jgi:hypothetical protein
MTPCTIHKSHAHTHGPGCGHKRVKHDGHEDFLHEGHLHHVHGDHVDEHTLAVSTGHPVTCTPSHACGAHPAGHVHGAGCGHEAVPHGDHVDYLVAGHLHYAHGTHCDDHGSLDIAG